MTEIKETNQNRELIKELLKGDYDYNLNKAKQEWDNCSDCSCENTVNTEDLKNAFNNYDKATCKCDTTCDCSSKVTNVDDEITIKLNLDAQEAFGEIEELSKKLNKLSEDGKVIVFNNCVFQFGKHALNINYHKPVDNSCGCDCCDE